MARVPVKLIKLQKDKQTTRLRFLEDKVERLHSPKKVWRNPGWALPTDGEVVELPEVKYDEATVIQVLEKAGGELQKITGLEKAEAKAIEALEKAIKARKDAPTGPKKKAAKLQEQKAKKAKDAASENRRNARGTIEIDLAKELHPLIGDLPRKVLFDNAFWFYLFWKSPIYGVHRYDTWNGEESELKSEERICGDWRRASIPAAYLAYFLAMECGISDADYSKTGLSRLRMWILDESPLISSNLRKSFVSAIISGKNLDDTWKAMFKKLGALDVDALTPAQTDALIAGL